MNDLISRKDAIDAVDTIGHIATMPDGDKCIRSSAVKYVLSMLPSAQPEYRMDEWCTDCKEYDHERHCCPRFNHVIRTTLQEVQAEQPGIIRCKDCYYCVAEKSYGKTYYYCDAFSYHAEGDLIGVSLQVSPEHFCGWAERRTDE